MSNLLAAKILLLNIAKQLKTLQHGFDLVSVAVFKENTCFKGLQCVHSMLHALLQRPRHKRSLNIAKQLKHDYAALI